MGKAIGGEEGIANECGPEFCIAPALFGDQGQRGAHLLIAMPGCRVLPGLPARVLRLCNAGADSGIKLLGIVCIICQPCAFHHGPDLRGDARLRRQLARQGRGLDIH